MWFRRRTDRDFQNEIEAHIRLEADRLIADGMPAAEAETAARRAFGNVTTVRERFHESRRSQWWDQLAQDLRYGWRSLRKTPGFTAAAALTIALGVGANTAVFSLVDAVLLQSLPVQNPKQLVFLEVAGSQGGSGAPPYPCFARLRAETSAFTGLATFTSDELRIEIHGRPEQVMGQAASGNYFELLGVKPALGRLLTAEDEKLDPPVAVISDRYWRRRFGGDPAAIGRSLSLRGQAFTIAGVTPPEFLGLNPGSVVDVTLPIAIERKLMADSGAWWLQGAIGRLKPGLSSGQAQAESNAIFQSFMSGSTLPADITRKHFQHLNIEPAAHGMDVLRRRFSRPLYVLMSIVGLVLLMATANIANLLLSRGIARRREFAIRLATGAGRFRLVRQLVTETLLLFLVGAIPGVAIASWGVGLIETLFGQGRRAITLEAEINWRVLAFSLAITLAAGLLSGLFPAWRAFRTVAEQAIKEGQARTTESRHSRMLTGTLVAFQVALSVVLLVGAVTFVRTLANLRNVDRGFQDDRILTMSLELPDSFTGAARSAAVWNHVLDEVRSIPGVRSAGLSTFTPLSGRDRGGPVRVRGYEPPTFEDSLIHVNQISEGYFETLGISLLRGRLPVGQNAEGAPKTAWINETAARKYFAGRDPIGQSLEFHGLGKPDSVYRIAGVVRDTKHMNLREPVPPFAFLPMRQPREWDRRVTLAVSSVAGGEMALVEPVRSRLATAEPGLLISEVVTIRSQLDSTLLTERLLSILSSAFGVLALILAAIGLYGVLSYRIGQQRQAIGIRMALGASPSSVALAVLRQSGLVIGAGILAGLPFAFLAARTADSLLWGVKSSDPMVYIAGVGLLCLGESPAPGCRRAVHPPSIRQRLCVTADALTFDIFSI
jgi:predicted permease